MKKTILLGLLGLAAASLPSFGQGTIALDNYDSTQHPLVTYGANTGGTVGSAITTGTYTAGWYFVNTAGNFVGSFAADASGNAIPTGLYSGPGTLTLATGIGSTGGINNGDTGMPGEYAPPQAFNPGLGEGATVTVMIIAYDTGSYAGASNRGHSTAFTMTTSTGSAFAPFSGNSETDGGFAVHPVPEPTVFALAGIGAAALMIVRRKK
jgi:hypothetical protein